MFQPANVVYHISYMCVCCQRVTFCNPPKKAVFGGQPWTIATSKGNGSATSNSQRTAEWRKTVQQHMMWFELMYVVTALYVYEFDVDI